jgi:hypothetical protein
MMILLAPDDPPKAQSQRSMANHILACRRDGECRAALRIMPRVE